MIAETLKCCRFICPHVTVEVTSFLLSIRVLVLDAVYSFLTANVFTFRI